MSAMTLSNPMMYMPPHMKGPLTVSMIFHGVVVILAIVGLPYIKPALPVLEDPITVEIVNIEDVNQTDKAPAKTNYKRVPPEQVKEPPKKPQAPQVTAKTPPKPVAPKRPDPADTVTVPDETATVKSESKPQKTQEAPKPNKRPLLTQSDETQEEAFKSVLRNLMPSEPTPADSSQATETADESSPLARFAQRMSMTELDSLRAQLSQCWKLMAGARYAEDLIVDIKLYLNPDRTIRDAQIVDRLRYAGDSHFRAAADSALRAVYNPRCNPLDVPPNKYEQWKVMTVTFDPREML